MRATVIASAAPAPGALPVESTMGTWKIEIEGHGCHHNRADFDANVQAAEFMRALAAMGHDHLRGRFILTSVDGGHVDGGTDDISQPDTYLAEKGPRKV